MQRYPSYQSEIQAMMFTFGEVRYPLEETSILVEDMLKSQACKLVSNNRYSFLPLYRRTKQVSHQMRGLISRAAEIALLKGARNITAEDLIFLLRRDPAKVVRLKEFLSWKDVRKNVKPEHAETFDDDEVSDDKTHFRRKSVHFQWEFPSCLTDVCDSDDSDDEQVLSEYYRESLDRLEEADRITRRMSKEEYIEFAECRQASFTYKKTKKFREWLGFPEKYRPADDIFEIIGFLLWEFLRHLTQEALHIGRVQNSTPESSGGRKPAVQFQDQTLKRSSPFYAPLEQKPLTPTIVRKAFGNVNSNLIKFPQPF